MKFLNTANRKYVCTTVFRLAIDCLMGAFVIGAMAGRYLKNPIHETMGIFFVLAVIIHVFQHLNWFRSLLRGRYRLRRILMTSIVLLLLFTAAVLTAHGTMMSRTWFAFMDIKSSLAMRQIHTTAAYWVLILMGIHTGVHWTKVKGMLKKHTRISQESVWFKCLFRGLEILIVVIGITTFFDKDAFSRLFMVYAFDFQNPEQSAVGSLFSYLAITSFFAISAHRCWSGFEKWRKNSTKIK